MYKTKNKLLWTSAVFLSLGVLFPQDGNCGENDISMPTDLVLGSAVSAAAKSAYATKNVNESATLSLSIPEPTYGGSWTGTITVPKKGTAPMVKRISVNLTTL